MKTKKYKKGIYTAAILAAAMMLASACGKKEEISVEDEVAKALAKEEIPEDTSENEADVEETDTAAGKSAADSSDSDANSGSGTDSKSESDASSDKDDAKTDSSTSSNGKYGYNPFLGDESTATSYDINFNIETDSGVAGFTWGSDDGTDGEYYLAAFDCTRDIPRLYTCRKDGKDTFDEAYTNLDFMYPEMDMFTTSPHIVEISVEGKQATVYLDSYTVVSYSLDHAVTVGQIGTWVMKGDYHEYIDDIFVAEGSDGSGDWIYSEDFSGKTSIFSPYLKTRSGRLYATQGYVTVPKTELMKEEQ